MKIKLACLVIGASLIGCQPATEQTQASEPVAIAAEVVTTGGSVRGLVGEDGLKQYHGIPYAAPPVGALRWAPTEPVLPWVDVKDAIQPGPACMQPQGQGGSFYGESGFAMDEDCLTVNVWTRASHDAEDLPVMVWRWRQPAK